MASFSGFPFHFFFPQQLAAFEEHTTLMVAAYSTFVTGNILTWPAIVTLAGLISPTRPAWALWGGSLAIFGLFSRTFHASVDHLAFELVRVQNLELVRRPEGEHSGLGCRYGRTLRRAGAARPPGAAGCT